MKHFFTIFDRFTIWPEAIPLPHATTKTCSKALIRHWISCFVVTDDITCNRGPQFTRHLSSEFNHLLGISASNTSVYHQQANGIVERFHCQLKSSLKYNWLEVNARQDSVSIDRLKEAFGKEADCQSPPVSFLDSSSSHPLRAAPSQLTTFASMPMVYTRSGRQIQRPIRYQ